MAAVTTNFRYVLIVGIPAVIAAVFLVARNRTGTAFMSAPVVVVVSHDRIPQVRFKFC